MGTPEFALPGLEALAAGRHQIAGIVTSPDRPRGRGRKILPPPVKVWAQKAGFPVVQPEKIKDPLTYAQLKSWAPHLIVVIAYGKILPPEVLALPPCGAVNLHASFLPKYRGAAPIARAIMSGEEKTGVTTIFMDAGLDTGDIILQKETLISPGETAGELEARLASLGAEVLRDTIDLISAGNVPRYPQDHSLATYAPPLAPEEEIINWEKEAQTVINLVRGLNPTPGARTFWAGKVLKVWRTAPQSLELDPPRGEPGEVRSLLPTGFVVEAGDGKGVLVTEVQPEGKKKMEASAFLSGYRLSPGTVLGLKKLRPPKNR